jgi:monoterpene epsilon-lactone hydrolase
MAQGARVAIAGDSAGGGLSLSLLSLVQDSAARGDGVTPVAVVVMSPWTDFALTGASMIDRANDDPLVTEEMLATAATECLAGHDPLDLLASPLHATLVRQRRCNCTLEQMMCCSVTHVVTQYLSRDAGGAAVVHIWEGMMHVFPSNIGMLEASDAAVVVISAFIKENLTAMAQ